MKKIKSFAKNAIKPEALNAVKGGKSDSIVIEDHIMASIIVEDQILGYIITEDQIIF